MKYIKYILARQAMVKMLTNRKNHVFSSKGMLQKKDIIFWSKLQPNYNSLKEIKLNFFAVGLKYRLKHNWPRASFVCSDNRAL